MRKKLYNAKNYDKICKNCERGRVAFDNSMILCVKKGLVAENSTCRAYKYDPLKRVPKKAPVPQSFDPKEFEL